MNHLAALQAELNAQTRDDWLRFGRHRRAVTDLLVGGPSLAEGRLCVLGAGNTNDVDLSILTQVFREVHLVDLDFDAMRQGLERQGASDNPSVVCHGGVDVTGVLDIMAGWSPTTPITDADLAACKEAPLQSVARNLPAPFDVAASSCLLSQLIFGIVRTAGEEHPRFIEAVQATRLGHLRLLADLVTPGGSGVLVTDVVSSDSFPPLAITPEEQLPVVLTELIRQRNFFHGLNPAVVLEVMRTDPSLAEQITVRESAPPWLWDLGARVYAVWETSFIKRAHAGPSSS